MARNSDEPTKRKTKQENAPETVMGKRCPECNWLDEETATVCFRCGYRYNVDHNLAGQIANLGVTLPPALLKHPKTWRISSGRMAASVNRKHYRSISYGYSPKSCA
ncbi:MAG: hypothetical protein R2867_10190 [Caldilineaceae bacterium]